METFKSRGKIEHVVISPYYSKLARVEKVDNGVITSSHQFVEYGVVDSVKSSEFSLGNLIAVGADGALQYVSMSLNSDMNFVDEFAKSYENARVVEKAD